MNKIINEIEKIEEWIKEDLLVCYGSIEKKTFTGKHEQRMDPNDTLNILRLLKTKTLEERTESICILLQTDGGHISEAIQIIEELRAHYTRVNFVVMTYAGSAGAFLSLCGDTLYMHERAFLSDFSPQNINKDKVETPDQLQSQTEIISILYQAILTNLLKGTMKSKSNDLPQVIRQLGIPAQPGKNPNGGIHGTPLLYDNLKKIIPENVKPHSEIPAPGNEMNYAADSFKKLDIIIRKYMNSKDMAKILVYNKKCVSTPFSRNE